MHVSVMRHRGDVLANLPSLAQRELARARNALRLVVAAFTVVLFHLPICMLHALRVVAINATMRLRPCREVLDHEVHVRSHI
jgi:hypothetical protein